MSTRLGTTSAPARKSILSQWKRRETLAAWLFLLPALVGFIVCFAVPAVRGFYIGLSDWDLLSDAE